MTLDALYETPCPWCGATRNVKCRRPKGQLIPWWNSHKARLDLARSEWTEPSARDRV